MTSLWDFTAEDPKAPDDADIQKVLPLCSSDGVTIDGQDITLPSDDIQFDVGAIAKGYIADRLKDFLVKKGVNSAIINLGGNVLWIATKPKPLWISPENLLYPPEFMRGALSRAVNYIIIS